MRARLWGFRPVCERYLKRQNARAEVLFILLNGSGIDREEANGSSVLWAHVRDGRSVGNAEILHTRAKELDKLADDTEITKVLQFDSSKITSEF